MFACWLVLVAYYSRTLFWEGICHIVQGICKEWADLDTNTDTSEDAKKKQMFIHSFKPNY